MCPSGRSIASNTKTASSGLHFRTAFDVLDADRDGKISKEDLRMFYAGIQNGGVGDDGDDDVIGSMMSVADFNKDGFVEYDEFERVLDGNDVNKKKRSCCNGVLEDVFKVMDKDGDGKLSHDDLKSYMQLAGFDANDEDIKAMIKLGSSSGGNKKDCVSFDDLIKILCFDL
ncbi:calcium-binding protein CP1 [Ricinus communis]|uniref:Nacl-inducible calcium binding, putative n=1 Tax=Ricinus communis TaxID=3988 RepID=B9RZS5_RICCO|nr:calcium-binding protein CP1 [Ricinus communis]EEF43108.1 nacl-inducible calcium binding, putative [Ricinus communis]|eukprot:XP_002519244.1 calcium-binding protein CP1 [Ricinus communis]